MALILLVAAALSAQPAKLVLGKDAGAELSLDAPAKASVTFSTSTGSVGEAVRKGNAWVARFTPPRVRAPSVALVLAQIDEGGERELHWLAIPLSGSDTMEIETRPGSRVEADVAGARIGPVTADKAGTAKLPMVVPPGVQTATLRITDKLGNTSEKPLDLEPPPFTRARMAARQNAAQADGALELEIFAVKADGTPDDDAKPLLLADVGEASVRRRIGHGVYLAEYEPPAGKSSGIAHVSVQGAPGALEVPIVPRAPGRLWQSALSPAKPWSVSLGAIGALGAMFQGGGVGGGAMLEGALRLRDLPLEALLDVGGIWFTEVLQQDAQSGATYAHPHTWLAQAGVRASMLLARGIDGHAAVLLGLQDQLVHVRSVTLPAGVDQSAVVLRAALALGVSMRAGPGRLLGQVQLDTSSSGEAGLLNNVGSAQLQVGYLLTLR